MIGIVDYGAGNLKSVANAISRLNRPYRVCSEGKDLSTVDLVVLPGVGQFASAVRSLRSTGLFDELRAWGDRGKPIVGICLGLQLLFEASDEAPDVPGLALLPGHVSWLRAQTVPHMGWNRVEVLGESDWLTRSFSGHYYFAHSFVAAPGPGAEISAMVEVDGMNIPAAVTGGAIRAVQFHPEKSADTGSALLERMISC